MEEVVVPKSSFIFSLPAGAMPDAMERVFRKIRNSSMVDFGKSEIILTIA
jgi:hypothetical protein